jgi:lanthanide-dependent methanol dehydrogenase
MTAYDMNTGKQVWRAYATSPDSELLFDSKRTTELGKPVGQDSSLKTCEGDQWKLVVRVSQNEGYRQSNP